MKTHNTLARWLVTLALTLTAFVAAGESNRTEAGFTLSFYNISNNSGVAGTVAGQLSVEVVDATEALSGYGVTIGATDVLFLFRNNVGIQSSISEIYFDDGTILAQGSIFNSLSGFTQYTAGATPGNLSGGNTLTPVFLATAGFSADAVGNPNLGVDAAADLLGIQYTTIGGSGYAGIVNTLNTGELRIGFHVRSIGQGGQSDSFVNVNPNAVPVPPTAVMLVIGLGTVGLSHLGLRLRRKTNVPA